VSPDRQTFLADGISVNSRDACRDSDRAPAAFAWMFRILFTHHLLARAGEQVDDQPGF
jgi:hypothetical protein